MVTIQETELKERGLLAITTAQKLGRPVLISEVHKMDTIDPLAFFNSGRDRYLGERFYWKDPSEKTVLIGLGITKQIQSDPGY